MKEITRREFLSATAGALLSLPRAELFVGKEGEPKTTECPIFYFHEIWSSLNFNRFVMALLEEGFHPIRLSSLVTFLDTGEKRWPENKNPFIITFDDGLLTQKLNALPFLRERKIPAVFAVMPQWRGDGVHRYMTNNDFKELTELGMEVICHTFNHPNLPRLRLVNPGAWESEIIESKRALEDIIGRPVEFFCYPYGAYDRATIEVVPQYYKAALSTRAGTTQRSNELSILPRARKS
ncbi:MAG: polysaccharide deacetylase family protein [Patescibacteria group bacterium]|mgnify:CR=1 FL=1